MGTLEGYGDYRFIETKGPETEAYFGAIARLRIKVFREFPYLYEGTFSYEEKYLGGYFSAPQSYAVLVQYRDEIVGASTGVPMVHEETHREVFARQAIEPESVFYFGESVLDRRHRGGGIGKQFFRYREAYARSLEGIDKTAFCAVERPLDHPRCPPDYRSLHGFWRALGYVRRPDMPTTISWQDLDESAESPKTLIFWLKDLGLG